MPIPVAVRSNECLRPRPLDCRESGFESSRRHGCLSLVKDVCCSGIGLCNGSIPHTEEEHRVCVCVSECDQVQRQPLKPIASTQK
jgi:hypothetical protein